MLKRLAVLVLVCSSFAFSQDGVPAAAKAAFDQGLSAAQQQQWGLALRYFSEAQTAAPENPTILFNLGLAHAKAGNEAAAIAWLNAYLAAAPQADNATAVRQQLPKLRQAALEHIGKIIEVAREVAQSHPGDDSKIGLDFADRVTKSISALGRESTADAKDADQLREFRILVLEGNGAFKEAADEVEKLSDLQRRDAQLTEIAKMAGGAEGIEIANRIRGGKDVSGRDERTDTVNSIKKDQVEQLIRQNMMTGTFDPAVFAEFDRLNTLEHPIDFEANQRWLAHMYDLSRHYSEAKTIALAHDDLQGKTDGLADLACYQMRNGDFKDAEATAREIMRTVQPFVPDWTVIAEAREKADRKDFDGAFGLMSKLKNVQTAWPFLDSLKWKEAAGERAKQVTRNLGINYRASGDIPHPRDAAVAMAILGDFRGAMRIAPAQSKAVLSGIHEREKWPGDFPDELGLPYDQYTYEQMTFIAARLGKTRNAEEIAQLALQHGYNDRWSDFEIPWAYVLEGKFDKAIAAMNAISAPPESDDKTAARIAVLKSQLLFAIAIRQIKASDLTAAEHTAQLAPPLEAFGGSWPQVINYQFEVFKTLARTYEAASNSAEAQRVYSETSHHFLDAERSPSLQALLSKHGPFAYSETWGDLHKYLEELSGYRKELRAASQNRPPPPGLLRPYGCRLTHRPGPE